MKHSAKGDPPESFVQWMRKAREAGLDPDYASLQNPEKADVVNALFSEQFHLCAYCGRRLRIEPRNCHIDHFWPQSRFDGRDHPDRRLDHGNFFMSCGPQSLSGGGSRALPDTCGSAKDDWFDVRFHVIPSDPDCEARFVYTAAGQVLPKDDDDQGARNMICQLNLNDDALVIERKKLLVGLERGIDQPGEADRSLDQHYESWRTPDTSGRLQSFAQVAYRYIDEERDFAALG